MLVEAVGLLEDTGGGTWVDETLDELAVNPGEPDFVLEVNSDDGGGTSLTGTLDDTRVDSDGWLDATVVEVAAGGATELRTDDGCG